MNSKGADLRRQPRRFVPRLDVLEDRTVPSCTASFAGGTITVLGSQKADRIVINDEGNVDPAAPGAVKKITVLCEGKQVLQVTAADVIAIVVRARGGNDKVSYNLLGDVVVGGGPGSPATVSSTRNISVALGLGNDAFAADLGGSLNGAQASLAVRGGIGRDAMTAALRGEVFGTIPASLAVVFDGGQGKDTESINATSAVTGVPGSGPGVDVGVNASISLSLLGGQDRDNLSLSYAGIVGGKLAIVADGGQDRDVITGSVVPTTIPVVGTTPELSVQEFGGQGRDSLFLSVNKVGTDPLNITAAIDGGAQRDACSTAGSNVPVTTTSCP